MNEKKSSKVKKDMAKSVHKARYLMMKIMTWKTTSRGTFRVDVSKLRDFFHNLYIKFFPTLDTLYLSIFFNFYFKNYNCFQLSKNVPWNEARENALVEVVEAEVG